MTITEFLLARFDDDVNAVRLATCPTCLSVLNPLDSPGEARVLAECEAKRRIVALEAGDLVLADWMPDCGGDWCLSGGAPSDEQGAGYFANYWPDDTVSVSVYVDGDDVAASGIVKRRTRVECQAFAEEFVRDNLPNVSPILRALAAVYADHPDYDEAWRS
jgi:hypothetical protein